ncbi:hypothetical protein pb186bvf_018833 [Paramecium bursaria]
MQDLENQYLKALEEDYNKQLNQKIKAQEQFHQAANNIKAFITKQKRQKQHYNAIIISTYWRFYIFNKNKRLNKQTKLQLLADAFLKIKLHNKQQKNNILKQVMKIQKYYRQYQTRRKKNLTSFIQRLKYYRLQKNLQNQIDSAIINTIKMNRKILIKQIAIKKEIQFIENIIEVNSRYFETNRIQYQKKLDVYIQQKCKAESDYIVKYDDQNDPYWIRLKDGKQLYNDPFIKLKEQNLKLCTQESMQSQENFIQEMENYKNSLIELLRSLK